MPKTLVDSSVGVVIGTEVGKNSGLDMAGGSVWKLSWELAHQKRVKGLVQDLELEEIVWHMNLVW